MDITILILIQILWSSRLHIGETLRGMIPTSKEKCQITAKKKDNEWEFYFENNNLYY